MESPDRLARCTWAMRSPWLKEYHDREWGVPVHDDRRLFEFLILEGAQAGLNWETILRRREHYRRALDEFDPARISRYTQDDLQRLLSDPGIIRNRAKITATVVNARRFLEVQQEHGAFDTYLWRFVEGGTIWNRVRSPADIPTRTNESEALSKDLRKRGFQFVGPTICYAYMQAVGLVNDHMLDCFRSAFPHPAS